MMMIVLRLVWSMLIVVQASALFAKQTVTGSGSIPRDTSAGYIDLTIKVASIDKALQSTEKRFAHRLTIYFKNRSVEPIPFEDKANDTPSEIDVFSIKHQSEESITVDDNSKSTVEHFLRVTGPSEDIVELLEQESGKSITFTVEYREEDGADPAELSLVASKDSGVAKTTPAGVSVSGIFKGVLASVPAAGTITYTDGKKKAATGLNIFAVKRGSGSIEVPALVHDPDANSDTEGTTCTINSAAADGTACVSCSEGDSVYLKIDDLPVSVFSATSSDVESASISGLDVEDGDGNIQEYLVFVAYRPDGIGKSLCYAGKPTENTTYTEDLDSTLEPKEKDPRCFIATASYGSAMHRDVEIFREFRDRVLLSSAIGRDLVGLYYHYSPFLADIISESPLLRLGAQFVLYPIARIIEIFID
jgi:hypothetical protein